MTVRHFRQCETTIHTYIDHFHLDYGNSLYHNLHTSQITGYYFESIISWDDVQCQLTCNILLNKIFIILV